MTRIDQETSYAAELVVAEPTDEEDEEEAPLQDEATPEALDPTEHRMSPMARISWTVAGLTILTWAFQLYGYVDIYPLVSLAVIGVGLWGLGTIFVAWQPRVVDRAVGRILAATTLAISIGAFVLWSFLQIVGAPAYGTDEIAFDQYAAQLLRHGLNPYTHSMAPAFSLFHVSPDGYTFLLNGHAVTSLSYPALSFLLYAPLVALGWTTQTAVVDKASCDCRRKLQRLHQLCRRGSDRRALRPAAHRCRLSMGPLSDHQGLLGLARAGASWARDGGQADAVARAAVPRSRRGVGGSPA
jgi:hypothetical protein